MDWGLLITASVAIIALSGLYISSFSRYLSIREHETYQTYVTREMDELSRRIDVLEKTRPTTGEIEAKLDVISKKGSRSFCRETAEKTTS
jgi:hypothetical protein